MIFLATEIFGIALRANFIYSADRCPILNDTAYAWTSGTSMAVPHVAGLAAIYLGRHPTASPAEVKASILRNATPGKIQILPEQIPDVFPGTPNLIINTFASTGLNFVSATQGP